MYTLAAELASNHEHANLLNVRQLGCGYENAMVVLLVLLAENVTAGNMLLADNVTAGNVKALLEM